MIIGAAASGGVNGLFLLGMAVAMANLGLAPAQWAPWVLGVQGLFYLLNELVLLWHRRHVTGRMS